MSQSEFDLPDRLSRALTGDTDGLSFSDATWGIPFPSISDLATLPSVARIVGLSKDPENLECLRRARQLVALKALSTTAALVHELPRLRALRMAFLVDLKLADPDLRALAGCRKLKHLSLVDAPTLTDLGFLADLPQLRSLFLHSVPRLDFGTFPPIPNLRELVFHGGFNEGAKVPSLAPLARLTGLRRLELVNVGARDGSLAPLASLPDLEALFLAGHAFEVEEYARLAASLPSTRSVRLDCLNPLLSQPSFDTSGQPRYPCPKCAQPRVLLTGKGTRISCLTCDAKRVEKHRARWEAARRPFG